MANKILQLYLGGKADAKSLSTLQQRNVKRILNVTPAKEAGITAGVPNYFENSSSSRIKYKRISVYDTTTSDLLPYADEIVQFVSNGLHHGSVLVHCQRGVSRSATAVIMFLMRKANMTLNASLKLCQRRRPIADPNPAFMDQLNTFERECWEGGHLSPVGAEYDNVTVVQKETVLGDVGSKDVDELGRMTKDIGPSAGGEKRKAGNIGYSSGSKKRNKGLIGPPRGPLKSAAIGPAMGPPNRLLREKIKSERDGDDNDGSKTKGAGMR